MAGAFETGRCPFCGRRAIRVEQQTGRRVDHRTKSGRKGAHCLGSGRHRSSLPEVRRG
ncbi:hypothetical protein [Saccharothrix stipae]